MNGGCPHSKAASSTLRGLPRLIVALLFLFGSTTLSVKAAAPTYLLSEGFEGVGYENSGWIVPPNSISPPEPDYPIAPLLGSQSLRCNGISFIQRPFVHNDPFYCYFRVRWASWSDYKFVVDWLDASQSSTATLLTSFGNKLEIKHGSVSVPGTTTIALNTTYHVWLEWTQGTGSDGTMKLFVSTDGTKPASPEVNIVTGNGVSTASFDVGPFGAGVDVVYDSILIDDEVIGSNPGGNAPPSISAIANQSTLENTAPPAIPFIVGDLETNATDLIVTGSSSDQSIIADASIVFGGSESNRTVTLTPAANQSGIATITLTVSDGASTSSTIFTITVGTVNTAPSISAIANQSTTENTPAAAIAFTIGDAQTAAASLGVEGISSNTTLVPNSNIVFGGSGSNRTVIVTPANGQTGTTTISISINDGQLTNATNFTLAVGTGNTAPSISVISGQSTPQDVTLGPINFTVADAETSASALTITRSSSNPSLIPNASLSLGGSDASRSITMTPAAGQSGSSTITVTVSDGDLTASRNFLVTVIPNGTGSPFGLLFEEGFEGEGYENSGWIEIGLPDPDYTDTALRDAQSMNLTGSEFIYRTFIATNNFNLYMRANWNTWADYIGFIYLENSSYGAAGSLFADNNVLQINHGFASSIGTTTIETNTTYHIWLEWNRGTGTNGTMNLFVSTTVIKPGVPEASITLGDGGAVERIYFGSFSSGFDVVIDSLFIDDEPIGSDPQGNLAPTVSDLADQTINEDASTDPITFTIGDVESAASSLTLVGSSSNTALVPNASIVFGGSDSNRTVTVTPAPNQFGTATITITVRDNLLQTNDTFLLTVNPINDEPVVTLPGGPARFTTGAVPVVLNGAGTVVDLDSPTLGGGLLSISIAGNPSLEDRLSIRNQGVGPGEIEVSGLGVAYGGVGIGTFAGGTDGSSPLVISFNSSATPEAAQALLRNITFQNVSETSSTLPRSISVVVDDGHGGTSTAATMTVNVNDVPANPALTWANPESILYGTSLTSVQQNATASVPGTFSYNPAPGNVLNAGVGQTLSVTFTPTDLINFNAVTTSVPITITPAPLLVSVDNAARAYGQTNPVFSASITGYVNGDDQADLLGPIGFITVAETNSPIGAYAVTPGGLSSPNYAVSFAAGVLTITPYALLVTVDNQTKSYGADLPAFTGTVAGVHNGDAISATFTTIATSASNVGSYAITAVLSDPNSLLTNYTVAQADGVLTITPAPLLITAENQSKVYGAANPVLTATFTGFVNGDTAASLDTPVTLGTVATAASAVGVYIIAASGAVDANYVITHVDGTLTVNPAGPLSLTILSADALGNATMRITSDPGQRIKIQASIDLAAWDDIVTLQNPTGTIDHTDPAVVGRPHRFYRAVLAP